MAESRLVLSNLMQGSRVRNYLPDQKLIVYHMWATSPSEAGCYEPDIAGWSGHLSITSVALVEALNDFETKGLISQDKETGEMFILDWFRCHKFDTAIRRKLLDSSIKKIQSKRLLDLVLEKKHQIDTINGLIPIKSTTYLPKESKVSKTKACKHAEDIPACVQVDDFKDKGQNHRKKSEIISGVKCWVSDDVIQTIKMVNDFGSEKVEIAVKRLIEKGTDPLPSKVEKELGLIVRENVLRENHERKFYKSADNTNPKKPIKPREIGLMEASKKKMQEIVAIRQTGL